MERVDLYQLSQVVQAVLAVLLQTAAQAERQVLQDKEMLALHQALLTDHQAVAVVLMLLVLM
jgi:hypothetical protein